MKKLNKTQINIMIARAEQSIVDLTIIKEHLDAGDIEAVKHFTEHWLATYATHISSLKQSAVYHGITL